MCKSHVRNYLVQLSHMMGLKVGGPEDAGEDESGATLCLAQSKESQLYFYINTAHTHECVCMCVC